MYKLGCTLTPPLGLMYPYSKPNSFALVVRSDVGVCYSLSAALLAVSLCTSMPRMNRTSVETAFM